MDSIIRSKVWALILTVSVLLYAGSAGVLAAESPGCAALGSTGTTDEFYKGDRVQMTVEVFSAGPFTPQLYYEGISQVTGTPLSPGQSGSIAFTIPTTQIAQVQAALLGSGAPGDYSISLSCVTESSDNDGSDGTLNISAPDDRLNWRMGDEFAVMFPETTDDGSMRLDVYCYLDGQGQWAFTVTESDVAAANAETPSEPVLLGSASVCRAEFYLLPNGELQMNIWTPEGKLYEIFCDDLQCIDPALRYTDPNQ